MIDWQNFAELNNMTKEEFQSEILTSASYIAISALNQSEGDNNAMKFTCEDGEGKIEMIVRRVTT